MWIANFDSYQLSFKISHPCPQNSPIRNTIINLSLKLDKIANYWLDYNKVKSRRV